MFLSLGLKILHMKRAGFFTVKQKNIYENWISFNLFILNTFKL